jgi:gas vesicle protein
MKKIWEVIKKVFIWLGAVFAAIFAVLFIKEMPKQVRHDDVEDDSDEINKKAAQKRDEAIARIERADARTVAESYGSVCDAISDGKERFRKRCKQTDN